MTAVVIQIAYLCHIHFQGNNLVSTQHHVNDLIQTFSRIDSFR